MLGSFVRKDLINTVKKTKCTYPIYNLDFPNKHYKPDILVHLAAESHVDKSIYNPSCFIDSNILGTYNLLQGSLVYWENLSRLKKENFKFLHISTDEVYGS